MPRLILLWSSATRFAHPYCAGSPRLFLYARAQPSFVAVLLRSSALAVLALCAQVLMRRNSVYIAFLLGGALIGERVCTLILASWKVCALSCLNLLFAPATCIPYVPAELEVGAG